MDIGTPERYLQASWDILEGRVETRVRPTAPGLLVGAGAEVAAGATVGPRAVVSRRAAAVAAGAEVRDSVLLDGCRRRRAPGSAARSSPPGSRLPPEPRSTARSSAAMRESRR